MIKSLRKIIRHCFLVFFSIIVCMFISVVLTACSRGNYTNFQKDDENGNSFGLPCIYIQTQNDELPVNKVDYVNCSFKITNTEDEMDSFTIDMKDSLEDKNSVGIRLRGNSTMVFDKKPYRIKFDKKQSFFGSEKNKNWVLLADYLDPSDMRNYTAFELAEQFENLAFTPNHHHVILYLNGEYQGLYLLTDHVDEKKGRTNVEDDFDAELDNEFPFLLEMSHDANEGIEEIDYFTIKGFEPIEVIYPKIDGSKVGRAVYDYIYKYMDAVLTLLKTGDQAISVTFRNEPVTLDDLVDEGSLMDFLLVNEIMGNKDARWKSIKMYKSKSGKLKFGPVWDFDSCATSQWDNTPNQAQNDLSIAETNFSLKGNVPMFWLTISNNKERLYNRFMEKRDCILEVVDQMFDYYKYIASAAIADAVYWYGEDGASMFKEQFEFLQRFLLARYRLLPSLLSF